MDYHQDRFDDFSLMVYKNENLFAILPGHQIEGILYSHKGLTYGGLVLLKTAKLLDVAEALEAILKFLHQNNISYLSIKVIPSFYSVLPSDELEYLCFKIDAEKINSEALMLIDFRNNIGFQKKRREGVNKANRNNLTIKVEHNFDKFWNKILVPNLWEKHNATPVHNLDEIKLLASRFPNNIKQVNVYKDDEIIAGCTVFITNTAIHPQYVSGDVTKNKTGSLDFLYDFLINDFVSDKWYFDFNTSSEKNGEILNQGLIFWKESCGARVFTMNSYLIKTSNFKNLPITTK